MSDMTCARRVREHAVRHRRVRIAASLRHRQLLASICDVEDVIGKHPGKSVLVAAALGFLVARAFRRE